MKKLINIVIALIVFILQSMPLSSQSWDTPGADFHREVLDNSANDTTNDSTSYTLNPTESILIGIPAGCLFGFFMGKSIEASSLDQMNNGFRGAIIGMSIAPFLHYEITRRVKGIGNARNRWAFCFGSNLTYPNYQDAEMQPGFSAGINRYYFSNKRLDWIFSLFYNIHRFKIPYKIIHYAWLTPYKVENNDIEFSAHYLDILLLVNYKLEIAKTRLNIGIGPFLSVQFLDNTRYITHWSEPVYGYESSYKYDYYYHDDEVVGMAPYIGSALNIGFVINKFIMQIKYKNAFFASNHIYALNPSTKLNTLEITLGIYLK